MAKKGLEGLRREIDEIDSRLIALIGKRRELALEIAKIKQRGGSWDDDGRVAEILRNVRAGAEKNGLDPDEMEAVWRRLIDYMISEQMRRYPY